MAQRRTLLAGAVGAALGLPPASRAQGVPGWPTRPVRIVIPFSPGGPTDTYARLLAEHLAQVFGQPFVAENRAGATGAIASSLVARSAPDGYTLLFASNSSHVLGPLMAATPAFDPLRDFTPISLVVSCPFYLLIDPRLPIRSVSEFVAYAKARPGELNFGSPGVGSGGHLVAELFLRRAGLQAVHVPFAGAGQVMVAAAGGQVQFAFDSVGTAQSLVEDGKLRGLGVTSEARQGPVPDVPTFVEAGYKDFTPSLWFGLLGPAGLPAALATAVNAEVDRFLKLPGTVDRLRRTAFDAEGGPPARLTSRIEQDIGIWGDVARSFRASAG